MKICGSRTVSSRTRGSGAISHDNVIFWTQIRVQGSNLKHIRIPASVASSPHDKILNIQAEQVV